ncbi:MAG TPA: class I SAM-dependent methyltransferase [Aggregatilineaceae bacterium]|nr:class I SAM-dependent methyltransferase [Aggregatilineaceae bacterium]
MSSTPYFNDVAKNWDTMRSSFFPEAVRVQALAAAAVERGALAADIGAGSGFVTEALLKAGLHVVAIDPSPAMLDVMRGKFEGQAVRFELGEADHLPLDDFSVDYVFGNMVLHHVENPPEAIQEMVRILRPGGKLVITDLDSHTFTFLREEQHDRWMGFERPDMQQWFEQAGLRETRVECVGSNCCADSACGSQRADVSIFLAYGIK